MVHSSTACTDFSDWFLKWFFFRHLWVDWTIHLYDNILFIFNKCTHLDFHINCNSNKTGYHFQTFRSQHFEIQIPDGHLTFNSKQTCVCVLNMVHPIISPREGVAMHIHTFHLYLTGVCTFPHQTSGSTCLHRVLWDGILQRFEVLKCWLQIGRWRSIDFICLLNLIAMYLIYIDHWQRWKHSVA